jgi:hypothetical protein
MGPLINRGLSEQGVFQTENRCVARMQRCCGVW